MVSISYPFLHAYYTRRALPNRLRHHLDVVAGRDAVRSLQVPILGLQTLLQVNPANITKSIAREQRGFGLKRMFRAGDWDRGLRSGDIAEKMKYRTIAEIMNGTPVEETTEFRTYLRMRSRHEAEGTPLKGPAALSREALIDYMQSLAAMYRKVIGEGRFDPALMLKCPIKAGITRDGEIVKLSDGNHRLALAHFAKIRRMPVEIRVIHADNLQHIRQSNDLLADLNAYLKQVELRHQEDRKG